MTPDEQSPVQKIEETKPAVWTPEDASRFLTAAIQEAQRPLSEALKERPVTSRAFTLIISILIAGALAMGLILTSQLEKTEKRVDAARTSREQTLSEKIHLQAASAALEDRLATAKTQQEHLQKQLTQLRDGEDELKRAKGELQRFRRQNELLRNQISGLEMEKIALARQLEAVKAMAVEDADIPLEAVAPDVDEPAAAAPYSRLHPAESPTPIIPNAATIPKPPIDAPPTGTASAAVTQPSSAPGTATAIPEKPTPVPAPSEPSPAPKITITPRTAAPVAPSPQPAASPMPGERQENSPVTEPSAVSTLPKIPAVTPLSNTEPLPPKAPEEPASRQPTAPEEPEASTPASALTEKDSETAAPSSSDVPETSDAPEAGQDLQSSPETATAAEDGETPAVESKQSAPAVDDAVAPPAEEEKTGPDAQDGDTVDAEKTIE